MTSVLIREKKTIKTHKRGKSPMKMEAETGTIQLQAKEPGVPRSWKK